MFMVLCPTKHNKINPNNNTETHYPATQDNDLPVTPQTKAYGHMANDHI